MRANALAALLAVMRGHPVAEAPVTPATRVTPPVLPATEPVTARRSVERLPVPSAAGLQVEPPRVTGVTAVTGQIGQGANDDCPPAGPSATAFAEPDADAIEERGGLAADSVPPVYLDAWARLNCQKPASVSVAEWWQALDDGGRFLDAFGAEAAELGWTPSELFGVPAGLTWQLAGERVEAIGEDRVRLSNGRAVARLTRSEHRGASHG